MFLLIALYLRISWFCKSGHPLCKNHSFLSTSLKEAFADWEYPKLFSKPEFIYQIVRTYFFSNFLFSLPKLYGQISRHL